MRNAAALLMIGLWALPAAGQPRAVDLSRSMTPVKDQGQRNTCSVFAATALVEYLVKKDTGRSVDLSEAYNYWMGKRVAASSEYLRRLYLHMDGLAGYLAVEAYRHSSMLESEWPYVPRHPLQAGDPRCLVPAGELPSTMCFTGRPPAGASEAGYRIVPTYIDRRSIGEFILTERKPVVMNILWCQACSDPSTGRVRMPNAAEIAQARRDQSGHVITLVGYDPGRREFRFRNSFGPRWGSAGYGTIPERYVVEACEVCPALTTPPDLGTERGRFVDKASKGVSGTLGWRPGKR